MKEGVEVLTTEEAAGLLQVATKTILTMVRDGALPGKKGRAWQFLQTDLVEFLHGDHRCTTETAAS